MLLDWHRFLTGVFLGLLCYCPCPSLLTIPGGGSTVRCLQPGEAPNAKFIRAPTRRQTCTSRGLLETNSNYRFCYSKSLAHRHFARLQTHGIHFKLLLCAVRLWDLWWNTEYERKTQRQGWFPDGQSSGCGLKSLFDVHMQAAWTFAHIYQNLERAPHLTEVTFTVSTLLLVAQENVSFPILCE